MEWLGTVCRSVGGVVGDCVLAILMEWLGTVCRECWWSGRGLCVGNLGGVVGDCV